MLLIVLLLLVVYISNSNPAADAPRVLILQANFHKGRRASSHHNHPDMIENRACYKRMNPTIGMRILNESKVYNNYSHVHVMWVKQAVLKEVFDDEMDKWDWILLLDADTLIRDARLSLLDYIKALPPSVHLVFPREGDKVLVENFVRSLSLSSNFLFYLQMECSFSVYATLIRVNKWGRQFLDLWEAQKSTERGFQDQGGLFFSIIKVPFRPPFFFFSLPLPPLSFFMSHLHPTNSLG